MQISIKHDVNQAIKGLSRLQRQQVPFATSVAINKTAVKVKQRLTRTIPQVFDRPNRMTRKSVKFPRKYWSTKRKLYAKVVLQDFASKGSAPADYLHAQIHGGTRSDKRSERALRYAGILYPDEQTVMSKYAKRNKFGNITAGQYTRMLSQMYASADPMQNKTDSTRSKKSRKQDAFFLRRSGSARGIWRRRGKQIAPFLVFVKRPRYQRRFQFYKIGNSVIKRNIDQEFAKALRYALNTMR